MPTDLRQSLDDAPAEAAFAHDGRYLAVSFPGPGRIGLFDSTAETNAMPEGDTYQAPKNDDSATISQIALHPYRHQLLYAATGGLGHVFGSIIINADELAFDQAFTEQYDYVSGGRVILFPDGKQAVIVRTGGANVTHIADLADNGDFTLSSAHIPQVGALVAGPENDRFFGGSFQIEALVPTDSDLGYDLYRHSPNAPEWSALVPNFSFDLQSLLTTGERYPDYRPAAVWALNTGLNRLERYPVDPDSHTLEPTVGGIALSGSNPVDLAISPAGYIAVIGTDWVEVFSYNADGVNEAVLTAQLLEPATNEQLAFMIKKSVNGVVRAASRSCTP